MDINVKMPTSEDINRQITEAIATSAIGEALQDVIKMKVGELAGRYSDGRKAMEKTIDGFILKTIVDILQNEYREQIK